MNTPQAARVLVVDDEPILRKLFTRILEQNGLTVTTASSGKEAITQVTEETFDAILIDLKMPGMSGIEAASAIRKTHPDLPIVVMSGFVTEQDEKVLEDIGVSAILSKPIQRAALHKAIMTAMNAS